MSNRFKEEIVRALSSWDGMMSSAVPCEATKIAALLVAKASSGDMEAIRIIADTVNDNKTEDK